MNSCRLLMKCEAIQMKCESIDMNGERKLMKCLRFHISTEKL